MGTARLNDLSATPGGTARVAWAGPLDLQTVPAFEERLRGRLRETCDSLVLDLRRVEYIDSAGLRFLLALRERLAGAAARIALIVRRESRVERTLRLVGFDQLFDLVSRADPLRPEPSLAPAPTRR